MIFLFITMHIVIRYVMIIMIMTNMMISNELTWIVWLIESYWIIMELFIINISIIVNQLINIIQFNSNAQF